LQIALPAHILDELRPRVLEIDPTLEIVAVTREGETDCDCAAAEALLRWEMSGRVVGELVSRMPRLRWMHTPSAGVDHILKPEVVRHPLVLTNSAGIHAIPIAEHVLTMVLMVAKQIPTYLANQRNHVWQRPRASEVYGATLGIVGTGHIGQEVGRRAQGLAMHVIGTRRHPAPTPFVDEVYPHEQLHAMLGQADFVAITSPLTPETMGLIGPAELHAMKPTAWLINVARGRIVQEAALLEALQANTIAGACLDVFAEEPLPPESPFWDLSNVVVTPHSSWASPHIRERTIDLYLENLRRFVNGEPLLNVVDKKLGY
jgi:phosphoglycerate dehydrogenase-like enzyme